MASIPYNKNVALSDISTGFDQKRGRPFLFTVTEPNSTLPLYDVTLALHTPPSSVDERMTKTKTMSTTYGGYVEYHWPDDLDVISASSSTGAFIAPGFGLTAAPADAAGSEARSKTIAYERFQDFLDLFHNNGMVYDSRGIPSIRGRVIMIYDRGIFFGHFSSFEVSEEDNKAFSFSLSWEFKIEKAFYKFPTGRIASQLG
jgi:hypothetical protein